MLQWKRSYEMLTGFVSVGVQVKIPVVLSKVAPGGRSVLSVSETVSSSGSVAITFRVLRTPRVTFKVLVTLIVGFSLAVNNNKQQLDTTDAQLLHKMQFILIHHQNTVSASPVHS